MAINKMWIYKGQIQTFRRAENNLIIIQYARCNKECDWFNFKMECWDTEISQFEDVLKAIGDFKKANDLNEIHLFENKENPLHYGIAMAPRTHGMATYFFDGAVDLNTYHLPYFLAETASLHWREGRDKLHGWFGLSYASFLTLPRVLMQEMPDEWQDKMADLLAEYDEAFPNRPPVGSRVQVTDLKGRLIKTPPWLINYRRPDYGEIDRIKGKGRKR